MSKQKTAYELARSQVATPTEIVTLFWRITHRYRSHFARVLDLGAGDGRFAVGGRYVLYEGVEIDKSKTLLTLFPQHASVTHGCAFKHKVDGYSACIGNPPYVRHHDLDEKWRDRIAERLADDTGEAMNKNCNLYVYFLFLGLLKVREDGLVSVIVPYEWVSRPSAGPLRSYIRRNKWHVDVYRFTKPIFPGVLTTASISIIDKRNKDGQWRYFQLSPKGVARPLPQMTGSKRRILPYKNRGKLWAMRGMSPGTQEVFTLTEGERIHAGLRHTDVLPCVTSLRKVPRTLTQLTRASFHKHFVEAGAKCWLIKSHLNTLSRALQAYLDHVPAARRQTWTCTTRNTWYRYDLFDAPTLLVSTGFTTFGPKVLVNSVHAHTLGSICGVYATRGTSLSRLRSYLTSINFEKQLVPHAKQLKKIEIRQLNGVLDHYAEWEKRRG